MLRATTRAMTGRLKVLPSFLFIPNDVSEFTRIFYFVTEERLIFAAFLFCNFLCDTFSDFLRVADFDRF